MEPKTLYARAPDGAIAYQIVGDGPIDLIFVPNWANNVLLWWDQPLIERFLRRLASFSRLILFDKRGTGASDPVPIGAMPTLEEWIDDVRIVMDAAGSERAALFGYGAGTPMTLLFGATHPDRASAIVIGEGYALARQAEDYPIGAPESAIEAIVRRSSVMTEGAILKTWAPSLYGDEAFLRWFLRYRMLSASPVQFEKITRATMDWDVRDVLDLIRVPTLLIHRTGDRFIPVELGRYVANHIPGAKYVELPGSDHVWFAGDQDALLDEVQDFLTGTRGTPDVDRVLATVLFTDIVSSTERAAAVGDRRWREVLDQHEKISRREVDRFRGQLVNTTGDGVLATFDGPARAIRCAGTLAEALRTLGVDIRSGLHTGEVELRGTDVGGIAVNLAARVMAQAGPRETLVSSTVKDLVVGSGIEFEDRGTHMLKGVPGEWHLYAVKL